MPAKATLSRADLDASRLVTSIIGALRHGRRELERRVPAYRAGRPDDEDMFRSFFAQVDPEDVRALTGAVDWLLAAGVGSR